MEKKILRKILIIDDDPDILMIATLCLQDLSGVSIKSLSSGEQAIQSTLDFQPDLILLDIMMPKMDGIAVLKAIRLVPSIADIPVIFFTAKVQSHEVNEYFKLGVLDVIVKPFDPLTLSESIKNIWEKQ